MTDRELMQQALEALTEYVGVVVSVNDPNNWTPKVADGGEPARKAIEAIRARLAEHDPCLVRPKEFIRMTLYQEDMRGTPVVMSVWPTPEDV